MLRALLPYPPRCFVLALVLAACPVACAQQPPPPGQAPYADSLRAAAPYAFDRPDTLFRLPGRLREISGLTVLDDDLLGAVQDEKGVLYLLNRHTGEVEDERRFEKDGDYEDLARVGERVFVLRSDGTLFEIEDWRADKLKAKKHKTRLSARYDTEGLAYDADGHRLLIACKEYAGKGLKHRKAVYAFDLEGEALVEAPAYTIDVRAISEGGASEGGLNERLRRALRPAVDLSDFKPAALALHPLTARLYVVSSVRKAVVVLAPDGAVEAVWSLPDPPLRQPAGIAFLPDGTLFLATEGAGARAALLRYSYRP